MKKILVTLLVVLAALANAEISGKYAGEFITGAVDARSLALGNQVLTSFYDANAVYHNPAYLPYLNGRSVTATHAERFDGLLQQEYAAYSQPWENDQFVGVAIQRIGVGEIPITADQPDAYGRAVKLKEVSDNEVAAYVAYARKIDDKFTAGANLKLLYKSFEEESAYGLGIDLAGLYKINELFTVGAKAQDLTSSILAWSTGKKEYIRPSLSADGEFHRYLPYISADCRLIAGFRAGFENYKEYSVYNLGSMDIKPHAGLELLLKELVYLRGGIENKSDWSAGTGIVFKSFNVDYTFKPSGEDLGDTHQVSLSYNWQ